MNGTDMTAPGRVLPGFGATLARWLARAVASRRRGCEIVRLAALSDHVLRDIGLTRDQARFYVQAGRSPH